MFAQYKLLNRLLFAGLLFVVILQVVMPPTNVQPDSPRYVAMGLNMAEYGVFSGGGFKPGSPPPPGLGQGGVFTAFEIALAARLSNTTKDSLTCISRSPNKPICNVQIPALKAIYVVETYIFHVAVFVCALLVFGSTGKAWLAVLMSFGFRETMIYADSILAEPSLMMASSVFLAFWIYAMQKRRQSMLWMVCGLALGLSVLIKPSFLALVPAIAIVIPLILYLFRERTLMAMRATGFFVIGALLVISPLFIRNIVELDLWALSSNDYLVASLSHRLAYNAMSWYEWLVGWVYYMPVSGAGRLFGYAVLEPLGWGETSYYVYGRDVLNQLALQSRSADQAITFLLEKHVYNDPLKAVAVTALLMWRGIFVGHVVGMLVVPLCLFYILFGRGETWHRFLILILPPLIMAGVHAMVSVSIYRYNILLVIPYALVLSHFFWEAVMRIRKQFGRVQSVAEIPDKTV